MNRLSDINLAIAVSKAGCLPSLAMSSYSNDWGKVFLDDKFRADLSQLLKETGNCNVLLNMTDIFLILHHEKLFELVKLFKVSHVEIMPYYGRRNQGENYSVENYITHLLALRSLGVKIVIKCLSVPIEPVSISLVNHGVVDGIIVKTSNGAGTISEAHPQLLPLIIKAKSMYPNVHIIGCGGITNAIEIKNAISVGATAVGLGTVFAMSKESRLCIENKVRLVFKKATDVQILPRTGPKQNAVVFKNFPKQDDENNTIGLEKGITESGEGHIFVGKGIENINEILSVAEIVDRLTKLDVGLTSGMNSIGG